MIRKIPTIPIPMGMTSRKSNMIEILIATEMKIKPNNTINSLADFGLSILP